MKKCFLLLSMCLLTTALIHAQESQLHQFVNKYKNEPGFTFAYLSKELFEVVSKSNIKDQDWQKLHRFVKDLGSLHVLATDSAANAPALYREALAAVPQDEYGELLTVRDGKENVRIWAKDAGEAVTDLVLLVGAPDEFVLINFSGSIDLGHLADLGRLFDAQEAGQLAQVTRAASIDFAVSPNPSQGEINIRYDAPEDQPQLLTVIDAQGRRVANQTLSGQPVQTIQLRELTPGLYWLQLQTRKGNIGIKQVQIIR